MSSNPIPRNFDAAKGQLRPIVRGRWHLEDIRLRHQLEGLEFRADRVSVPLCHDTVLMLGYDRPELIQNVLESELDSWGVSFADAVKQSIQNLRAVTTPRFSDLQCGVRIGTWGDGNDISRILLPEVVRASGIEGDVVMMMPSRRAGLLLAPARSADAQRWMLGYARQIIADEGGIVSTSMFCYQDRRVAVHPPGHPVLATKSEDLQKIACGALYQEQKTLLDALHQRQRRDIFVAGLQMAERPSGYLTACSWTKGVTTLLPKADLVAMVSLDPRGGDQHQTKLLEWDTMRSLAGERLDATDHFPPRFQVSGFPSAEALAAAPAFKV